jgi:hypothetical protein
VRQQSWQWSLISTIFLTVRMAGLTAISPAFDFPSGIFKRISPLGLG